MRSFYSRYDYLFDVLFLAVIFWLGRYFYSSHFGLYEDDLTRIPDAISMNLLGIWDHLGFLMTRYFANRPLHEGLIYMFSWLGWQIDGLWGAYWIGYLITVVNIALFYFLLKKIHSRLLGLLGGLAYALFSADTTQAYLTMSLGGQLSNTFLLAAFHIYLYGRRWISYVLIYPIILFAYETPFLVFMAAPLLNKSISGKQFWKTLFVHFGILMTMLLSSFLMRYTQGRSVEFEMGYAETAHTALIHLAQGPLVALGTYLYRPYQVIMALTPAIGIFSLISFILIGTYLWMVNRTVKPYSGSLLGFIRMGKISSLDDQTRLLFQLAVAGVVMLVLAYPLTFTTRLTAISGRTTRGHLAGVSGASLVFAVFSYAILMIFAYYHHEKLAIALLSGWFALLLGFGVIIQQDYIKAWQYQKDFWAKILPLIPDAGAGTAILVQPEGLDDVLQIGANTWNMSRVLNQLYVFPVDPTVVPRVYRLIPGWQDKIALEDGSFQINSETVTAPPDNYNIFQSDRVIIISTEGGSFKRVNGPPKINGVRYPLKPQTEPVLPYLQRGVLYSLLLNSGP